MLSNFHTLEKIWTCQIESELSTNLLTQSQRWIKNGVFGNDAGIVSVRFIPTCVCTESKESKKQKELNRWETLWWCHGRIRRREDFSSLLHPPIQLWLKMDLAYKSLLSVDKQFPTWMFKTYISQNNVWKQGEKMQIKQLLLREK